MPKPSSDRGSARPSSRGQPRHTASEGADHRGITQGISRVSLAVPPRIDATDHSPSGSTHSTSRRALEFEADLRLATEQDNERRRAAERENEIPRPGDSARGGAKWVFPADSRSESQSRAEPLAHSTPRDYLADAYNIYGVLAGEPSAAKRIASRVAVDGAKHPDLELIEAMEATQVDLAAAIEFASTMLVENCTQLEEGSASEHGPAISYLRIWAPINADAERIREAVPESVLRYMLFLCLLAVEEVHEWANIGRGGPPGLPKLTLSIPGVTDQPIEVDYRKTHGLAVSTDDGK